MKRAEWLHLAHNRPVPWNEQLDWTHELGTPLPALRLHVEQLQRASGANAS